ncbi:Uncharacterized protein HZ326_16672 [Fusarium oxysporum f. sp. albedinis]|nr:Uncharacterized protein HZ326_16672 [Fusarium oxysporum f. sp. albedinis]
MWPGPCSQNLTAASPFVRNYFPVVQNSIVKISAPPPHKAATSPTFRHSGTSSAELYTAGIVPVRLSLSSPTRFFHEFLACWDMAYLTPYYPPPPDLNQTQTGSPPSQYFPPPQPPSSASIQNMYGSPGSTSKVPGYQQQTLQPENDADIYELAHNIYHPDDYSTLATMVPQATTVVFRPPPTALAPAGGHVLSDLPPAPHDGIMSQPDVSSPYSPGLLMPAGTPEDELPTDLARGQGRRGTLPNAAGRRAAPKSGTGARNTVIPVKDADGQ